MAYVSVYTSICIYRDTYIYIHIIYTSYTHYTSIYVHVHRQNSQYQLIPPIVCDQIMRNEPFWGSTQYCGERIHSAPFDMASWKSSNFPLLDIAVVRGNRMLEAIEN